jgi:hypothetical protein
MTETKQKIEPQPSNWFRKIVTGGSHLFDYGKTAKPFRVTLDNARFFPGKRLACRLLTPVQQSATEHALAEKTKDFSKFTCSTELTPQGDAKQTVLEVPTLKPWGLLVITPLTDKDD